MTQVAAARADTSPDRRWWILVGACMGLFVLMLDSTIVTLALPAIQHDLDASTAELQWVLNGYLLVIAALVITLSRLGDVYGRRRMFVAGLVLFTAGSAVSATAPDPLALLAGRIVQGLGAAATMGLSLAIVSDAFPPQDRPRALGIWTAVSAMALSVGPLAGGVLVEEASWRWIFWINIPFLALGVGLTLWAARESRDEEAVRRLDVPGLLTLTVGLTGVVLGLVQAKTWGWSSVATVACLAGGAASLGAFWIVEHRVAHPIVEFELFRNKPYFGASAAGFALVGAYWSVMFFQPQYLQETLDYSAVTAGLLILPITVPMVVISPAAGRLIARFGTRWLMTAGLLLGAVGLVLITRVTVHTGYGLLAPAYILFGLALGLVYAPMSTAAMTAMPAAKAGIAAGVLAMNRVMAGALGLAVVGALYQHLQRDQLDQELRARGVPLPGTARADLEGILAGRPTAHDALRGQPAGVVDRVEHAARATFSFALANSTWILVGMVVVGAVCTAAFLSSRDRAHEPAHPHRWRHFHF